MNPGPAISTLETMSLAGRAAMIACASSRGLRFAAFGELQRRVGREVAVRRIAGALDHRRYRRM